MVQGEVEAVLNDTLAVEIARSGRFTGGCDVEEPTSAASMKATRRCASAYARATGRFTGTIRYAQLQLERGGQIAGNIIVINADGGSSKTSAAPVLDRVTATFRRQRSEWRGERAPAEEAQRRMRGPGKRGR